jgi:hypothetical protein
MTERRGLTTTQALHRVQIPDSADAQDRTWQVVRAAYSERPPLRRSRLRRPVAAFASVTVLVGALALALSPAGATVGRWIRHALGVKHAASALYSLPTRGSLLVSGASGTWKVAADGAARRIGPWQSASWSPHALYIAATSAKQLVAVDPHGTPHWALARPAVSDARWYPPTGYRIAYRSRDDLRIVAGDGTGDHLLAAHVGAVAPTWRPRHPYEVSYVEASGRVVTRDADTGARIWSVRPRVGVKELAWSANGARLLALGPAGASIYDSRGRLVDSIRPVPGAALLGGALAPDAHSLALIRGGADGDVVVGQLVAGGVSKLRAVLSGSGLRQLDFSPDGRWLLVSWPAADQWVFVRVAGKPRIAAVSRIARQFAIRSSTPGWPKIEGWCCTADGGAG